MHARSNFSGAAGFVWLLVLLVVLPSRNFGYVYLGSFWPEGTVTMQLQLHSGGPALTRNLHDGSTSWNQVAQAAVQEWNKHVSTTKLAAVNNASTNRLQGNGQNDVYWATEIDGYVMDEYVLGVTLIDDSDGSGVTKEADVVINRNARVGWDSYRGPLQLNGVNDLRRVMMHELGHVLGLGHPDEEGQTVTALMNSSVSYIDNLASDDIKAATYVYGPRQAPVIARQPSDVTIERFEPFEFVAEISGRGPLSYQWLRNGEKLIDGNNASGFPQPGGATIRYRESSGTVMHAGEYRLVVSNPFGEVVSAAAQLEMASGITRAPVSQNVVEGQSVTFSVEATATGSVSYEWRRTVENHYDEVIPGATGPSYTIPSVSHADVGMYVVSLKAGDVYLDNAGAQLGLRLGFRRPPASQGVKAGDRVTLDAEVIGKSGLSYPQGVVADPEGNFYVGGSSIRKVSSSGVLSSFLELYGGGVLARRSDAVLFFAHGAGRTIYRMAAGVPVPFAGNEHLGDRTGLADRVSFGEIVGLTFASDGSLYVADRLSRTLRAVNADGVVREVAGSGPGRNSWDPPDQPVDGVGAAARFGNIQAIAADGAGNVYVVDAGTDYAVIRKVSSGGAVTTLAGNTTAKQQVIDGTGAAAAFWNPRAMACDAAGQLYVIDSGTLRKVTQDGVVTTLAGMSNEFGAEDGAGTAARFSREASGLAVGKDGAIYVGDAMNHALRRVSAEGVVTTFAGRLGEAGDSDGSLPLSYQWLRNGAPIAGATEPTLVLEEVEPEEIGDYQLRIANSVGTATSAIAKIDWLPVIVRAPQQTSGMPGAKVTLDVEATSPSGRPLTYQWKKWDGPIPNATEAAYIIPSFGLEHTSSYSVVVSDGFFSVETEPVFVGVAISIYRQPQGGSRVGGVPLVLSIEAGSSLEPLFSSPRAVVGDDEGNIYVADSGNYVIRKISVDGRVTTVAGKPGESGATDGAGSEARFGYLRAMAIDTVGNLYVTDSAGTIRRVSRSGVVTTLAGKAGAYGHEDGTGVAARFRYPAGLVVSSAGDIYVCEVESHTIRKVTASGVVSTLCGEAGQFGDVDGPGASARFMHPAWITMDTAGDLIVTDGNRLLRRVTLDGDVSTFSRRSTENERGEGPLEQVDFGFLGGIVADRKGNLFVIDDMSVRKIGADGYVSAVAGYSFDIVQMLDGPSGLWVSEGGDVIVSDAHRHLIRKISRQGVSILAGQRDQQGHRDGTLTHYEWFFNGVPIPGADRNVLVATENFQVAHAGRYSVTISNAAGSLSSEEVEIGHIATHPLVLEFRTHTRTVEPNEPVEFVIRAQGGEPMTYQWRKDGVAIAGETSSKLRIAAAQWSDRGGYSVVVTNAQGRLETKAAILNVRSGESPAFAKHPSRQVSIEEGQPMLLTAQAVEAEGVSYQWFKDGVEVPGATSPQLSRKAGIADAGTYVARIANEAGWMFSHPSSVMVRPLQLPTFPFPAFSAQARVGQDLRISGSVSHGREGMTFQWFKDGAEIPGATQQDLLLERIKSSDAGVYSVTVTIPGGSVSSERATVTVVDVPGVYFGEFSDGGRWAMQVRPDRTGVFIGYLRDRGSVVAKEFVLNANDTLFASTLERMPTERRGSGLNARRVDSSASSALSAIYLMVIAGVGGNEASGTVVGASLTLTGAMDSELDEQEAYFSGTVRDGYAGEIHMITSPAGKTLVVAAMDDWVDAAFGTLDEDGKLVAEMMGGGALSLAVDASGETLRGEFSGPGGVHRATFVGLGERAVSTTRLAAISTRSRAGTGDQTLIMGFVVAGSGEKELVARGVGPTLTALGVANALGDPEVLLYQGNGSLLDRNNNWGGDAGMLQTFARLGMSPVLAADSKDAALVKRISPGLYTAHVTAAAGGTGIALVEVYDGDVSPTSRFSALSTRTVAGPGENTLIAGVVLSGDKPKRLLIRGVGPSLVQHGVEWESVLGDPQVAVFRGNEVIARNDNWGGTEELMNAFETVGLAGFLSGLSNDAALMVTLEPGVYTVHVSGAGNTSGVALVEVYEMP